MKMSPIAELVGGFVCGLTGGLIGVAAAIVFGGDAYDVWSLVGALTVAAAGWLTRSHLVKHGNTLSEKIRNSNKRSA